MKDKELKPKQEVPLVFFTGKIVDSSICIFVFSYFNCQQRRIVGSVFGKCLTRGASSSRVWDSNWVMVVYCFSCSTNGNRIYVGMV